MSFHDELRACARAADDSCNPTAASDHKAPAGDEVDAPPDAGTAAASGCPGKTADAQTAADIGALLLQLLQGVASAAADPTASLNLPPAPEEGAASEDAASEMLVRVLELLKQLAHVSDGAALQGNPDTARWAALVEQLDELAGAPRPAASAGHIHRLLAELREHLSGGARGPMLKETSGDGLSAAPEPGEKGSVLNDAAPAGMILTNIKSRQDAIASGVFPAMQTPGTAGSEPNANPSALRSAFPAEPPAEAAKPQHAAGETPASPQFTASLPAAVNRSDGQRGSNVPETPGPSTAAPQTDAPAGGIREDQDADRSGSRRFTEDRSLWKEFAGANAAPDNGASAADSLEMSASDPQLTRPHEAGPEKTAVTVAAGKEKEPAAGTPRTGLFDQIVQRAVVQVRNDQSEIKIDLKPDFLGNVRMQILTENQQVSVRITTEFPAVRDMIEAGLQQLKSELQNQGLHVDRLEVSVSDDPHKHSRRQAKPDVNVRTGSVGGIPAADRRTAEERLEPAYFRPRPGGAGTIDMFA